MRNYHEKGAPLKQCMLFKSICSQKVATNPATFTCSKSIIQTVEKGIFIANFECISHLFLMSLFLSLNK